MPNRALLVEDDPTVRFMMSEMLEEIGVPFDEAADGQECLDAISAAPDAYSLILMDIHMPEMSGVEAVQLLRGKPSDPPRNIRTIALTADQNWHDEKKARDVGFDGVIAKPVRMKTIQDLFDHT